MEPCIRLKHPLAMTKPIFFPAAVLQLSQAYSIGKHILDTLDAPCNISLDFITLPQSLPVLMDTLMMGMSWKECGKQAHTEEVVFYGHKTREAWLDRGSPETFKLKCHEQSFISKALLELLIWKPLSLLFGI